jgi:hypothetical protein
MSKVPFSALRFSIQDRPRVQRVPAELLKHLGEQMEIPVPDSATLRALYKNRRAV